MSNKSIKAPNNSLAPTLKCIGKRMYVKFSGSCLKQDKITLNHKKIFNIYIVYDLKSILNNFDLTLQNCLFGAVKLTKNSDIDKYKYSDYGIGFDSKGTFSHPSGRIGADMSSSAHPNDKTKNILILGEGFIQGLDDTALFRKDIFN